jgi:hypothetical protein
LIRYSGDYGSYQDFRERGLIAANQEATEPRIPRGYVNVINFMVAIMTWLTVTEYHICPRICAVLLSSSGEETDYHSRVSELTQDSSCNSIKTVGFSRLLETTPPRN